MKLEIKKNNLYKKVQRYLLIINAHKYNLNEYKELNTYVTLLEKMSYNETIQIDSLPSHIKKELDQTQILNYLTLDTNDFQSQNIICISTIKLIEKVEGKSIDTIIKENKKNDKEKL